MVFVKAKCGPPNYGDSEKLFTVQYIDEKGNMLIRSGGSRAWRCNNPGNLHASGYSTGKSRRSIGTAGDSEDTYAVYPDYATGHEALVVMLRGSVYSPMTLREAMNIMTEKIQITSILLSQRLASILNVKSNRLKNLENSG